MTGRQAEIKELDGKEPGVSIFGTHFAEASFLYGYLAVNAVFLGVSLGLQEPIGNLEKFFFFPMYAAYSAFLANRVRISLSDAKTRTGAVLWLFFVPAFVLASVAVSETFGGSGALIDFAVLAGAVAFGNYVVSRISVFFSEGRDGWARIYAPFSKFLRFAWNGILFPAFAIAGIVAAAL